MTVFFIALYSHFPVSRLPMLNRIQRVNRIMPVVSPRLRRLAVMSLFFCLAFFPLLAQAGLRGVPATRGVVSVDALNVRKAPNKRSRRLFGLHRRTRVAVVEERGSWVKIRTGSGREGWVFRSLLKITRPKKTLPEIALELNNISPDVGPYFSAFVPALRKRLQSYFPQRLKLVISRHPDSGPGEDWLFALEIPFTLAAYRESKGRDVGEGTLDLLPYLRYLHGLLQYRDAVLSNLKHHPEAVLADAAPPSKKEIACYVNLVKDARNIVFLTGELEGAFAVFADHLFIKVEGYRPLKITALLPGCVRDFNKFVLPEPYSYDGRRTTVAAVYDFFGFSY